MKLTIKQKLIAGILLVLVFLILMVTVAVISTNIIDRAKKTELIMKGYVGHIHHMEIMVHQLLMPVHDYIITGDITEKDKFESILREIKSRCTILYEDIKLHKTAGIIYTSTVEEEKIASIKESIIKLEKIAREIFDFKKPSEHSEIGNIMKEMDTSAKYIKKKIDTLRKFFSEDALITMKLAHRTKNRFVGINVVLAVLLFFLTLTGGISLFRQVTVPMGRLIETTEKVASGDLSARAEVIEQDEIGELATSFNKMTEDLSKTLVSKDYVDNIIKSMVDTLLVVDLDGKIKTVNKAMSNLLGYEEDELIGKPVGILFAEEEEEEEELFEGGKFKKLLKEGSVRDYRTTYLTKNGEKIPVSFSGSVMYASVIASETKQSRNGIATSQQVGSRNDKPMQKIIGIVGVAKDMRELNRLMQKEKELAAATASAETEKKKAAELEKTYKDLSEKTQRLERFNKVTVGREMEMVKLKEEINSLLEKTGQPKKYESPEKIKKIKGNSG